MPADLIGARYQLHRELARTPQLAVYEAEDRRVGASTGIALALGGGHELHHGRRLLGRRMARTVHPHVVSTYDRGIDGNRAFVAFRRPPRTLAAELDRAPYPPHRVAELGVELSSALAVLHRAGIRLGTLHPGHVGFDADGAVRLSPWPLAGPPGGWGGHRAWSPPEIVAGGSPSIAGDVWSLGAVLLSSLVGSGPGQLSASATEELADHLRHDANPVLVDAIGRSMVADPSRRFATAGRMGSALRGDTATRRPLPAAGLLRLTAGTRRVAVASAAVAGVLSATTVGVALTSLGGPSVASGGGGGHLAAASAPPPAAFDHHLSPPAPVVSAPHGAVVLSETPASGPANAAPTGHVVSTAGPTIPPAAAPDPPAPVAGPPSAPTTSAPTTPAPRPAPPDGSGDQPPSWNSGPTPDPGDGATSLVSGPWTGTYGSPYGASGLPSTSTSGGPATDAHDQGGPGG